MQRPLFKYFNDIFQYRILSSQLTLRSSRGEQGHLHPPMQEFLSFSLLSGLVSISPRADPPFSSVHLHTRDIAESRNRKASVSQPIVIEICFFLSTAVLKETLEILSRAWSTDVAIVFRRLDLERRLSWNYWVSGREIVLGERWRLVKCWYHRLWRFWSFRFRIRLECFNTEWKGYE